MAAEKKSAYPRVPMRRTAPLALAVSLAALAACGGGPEPKGARFPGGPTATKRSTAQDRQAVSITVYGDFGLVREVRRVDVGRGKVSLEVGDVAAGIEPATVHIKSLENPSTLSVLEQNYRFDLLSPQKLLEKYVGRKVKIVRYNEKEGRDEEKEAEVLAAQQGTVLRMGSEVTYGVPGRLAFPEVPANLIAKPTLVWLVESTEAKHALELTYLTKNVGWHADYVLAIEEAGGALRGDLVGWVTLDNQSGTSFENAQLKLVAGDVQRVHDPSVTVSDVTIRGEDDARRSFKEESFFEYHLYSLARPTNLLDKEQKQVQLLDAQGIRIDKKLVFWGAAQNFRGEHGQIQSNQKVGVYLDLENSKQSRLGMPLPKGVVRVYQADKSGARQFVGEDHIDHTPEGEKIRIKMGEAFDVVGERRQTDWKTLGTCVSESAWEVVLRNHKDAPQAVEVYEPAEGDWQILQSSQKHEKRDAHTFTFSPVVPARGETKITYRVRVTWC
jgi:hypothetical protein